MSPMICFECGKLAEPPFTTMRWSISGSQSEKIICHDCCETIAEDAAAAKEIEQEARNGSICAYCDEPFDTPGGTTIESPDRILRRVHPECKAEIERLRGKA
jgi:uncharacterized CHY-type Zn-finger protein